MFMRSAKKLCPELVVVDYRFDVYEDVTTAIYTIFMDYTNKIQVNWIHDDKH